MRLLKNKVKSWKGLLKQRGTDNPEVIVLVNDFNIRWTRTDIGIYHGVSDRAMMPDRTIVNPRSLTDHFSENFLIEISRVDTNTIKVVTVRLNTLAPSDDVLDLHSVEVDVYK